MRVPEPGQTQEEENVGAFAVAETDRGALLLVCPSDYATADSALFRAAVAGAARDGPIVTLGIAPTRPETGYGYLALGKAPPPGIGPTRPAGPAAARGLRREAGSRTGRRHAGRRSPPRNSGTFVGAAKTIIAVCAEHEPELTRSASRSLEAARPDLAFLRLDPESWSAAPDISVDTRSWRRRATSL